MAAGAFKLPGPRVMRGKLAPVEASAKRENERGRYIEVRQQRNQDEVRLEEVRRAADELLMPRSVSKERDVRGGRSRTTGNVVVAAPYLQGTEKAPGSAKVLTEALQQAVAAEEWRELWILLGQIELWLTISVNENPPQPWWMLSVVVTAEHGAGVVPLAGGEEAIDLEAPSRAANRGGVAEPMVKVEPESKEESSEDDEIDQMIDETPIITGDESDPDERDEEWELQHEMGRDPLAIAINFERLKKVRSLLQAGANPWTTNMGEYLPFTNVDLAYYQTSLWKRGTSGKESRAIYLLVVDEARKWPKWQGSKEQSDYIKEWGADVSAGERALIQERRRLEEMKEMRLAQERREEREVKKRERKEQIARQVRQKQKQREADAALDAKRGLGRGKRQAALPPGSYRVPGA